MAIFVLGSIFLNSDLVVQKATILARGVDFKVAFLAFARLAIVESYECLKTDDICGCGKLLCSAVEKEIFDVSENHSELGTW